MDIKEAKLTQNEKNNIEILKWENIFQNQFEK